ncbi:DNA-protecting protein DprA [Candidatus Saccharibacteria bacterium]|nr:DNA-protecting protein DprA [Candidatus Saccharibacteria bacterium]
MSTLFSHFFQNINQIRPLEADFTEVLESIALKPKILYFHGKMPENMVKNGKMERPKTVAIVGSRKNTRYGQEIAYKLAYELARNGVIVVSGLAYGIDSIAHQGALDAGGVTVAVLGTPIDKIYPATHKPLAAEIIKTGGAVISEYAPRMAEYKDAPIAPAEAVLSGVKWLDYNYECPKNVENRRIEMKSSFLYRNRLISGLSDIVVIIEAAEHSGTLNTAAHALNQGKDVYAVPGNITNPYSKGCNNLIKQGAIPYTEPDDILRVLFPENYQKSRKPSKNLTGDTEIETKILNALAEGLRSGEEIMKALNLKSAEFNEAITFLEIKSRIRPLSANNWSLA